MHANKADFTLTFRGLYDTVLNEKSVSELHTLFANPATFDNWADDWKSRLGRENKDPSVIADLMRRNTPAVIPRNHLVEQALDAAVEGEDFDPFEQLLNVLTAPFEEPSKNSEYTKPPEPSDQVYQTFCGT